MQLNLRRWYRTLIGAAKRLHCPHLCLSLASEILKSGYKQEASLSPFMFVPCKRNSKVCQAMVKFHWLYETTHLHLTKIIQSVSRHILFAMLGLYTIVKLLNSAIDTVTPLWKGHFITVKLISAQYHFLVVVKSCSLFLIVKRVVKNELDFQHYDVF